MAYLDSMTGTIDEEAVESIIQELERTDPERAAEYRMRMRAADGDPETLEYLYDELTIEPSDFAITNTSERA